ncbi:MAG: PAS domain-containing protein [Spirochaetales bacterium]|nr:PAS domain-containing protein [Spirochaetales bacterium]
MNKLLKTIFSKNRYHPDECDVIFNAFTDPVIVYNALGCIIKANKAAEDFLQFNPIGLHTIGLAEIPASGLSTGKPDAVETLLSKALKGEIGKDVSCQFTDKNGNKRFCSCSAAPILDRTVVAGIILVWHDITEITEKEKQLEINNKKLENLVSEINEKQKVSDKQIINDKKEIDTKDSQIMVSNKLLEIIFSNTHFLIAYLSTDFTFIQVNDAYARAFNRSPDFFAGKNHFDLFPNEENKAVFSHVVKSGVSYITYVKPFFHPDKSESDATYWDWSLQPIKNNNKVEGIILVLIDVTRRKKAEEDLFNAKRLSDIGTLAATVAHELRNPLAVIQAAIYNIKRKSRNSDIEKHIENINAKVEESEQIINNLLGYSKFKIPQKTDVSIYNFLNDLFDDIQGKMTKDTIIINRKYESLKDTIIHIDPVQIREVLNNIVNNAYQAIPQVNGRIEIQGNLSGNNRLNLYITDNGNGIENEDLEKIFNPFFTNKSKGTGLGLTICKELIKLHNGNIEILSQKGEGTIVRISLPLNVIP